MLSSCCRRTALSAARRQSFSTTSLYDIADKTIDGQEVQMKEYQGSVLLFVNVASKWGLTKDSYTQLSQLVNELGPKGLKVLAFPCNQFKNQEPGSGPEILEFVKQFDKIALKFIYMQI